MIRYLSVDLGTKTSLLFILTFTTVAVIDSNFVKFYSISNLGIPSSGNVVIFVLFTILFSVISIFLLNSVENSIFRSSLKFGLTLRYFHGVIFASQILTISIIAVIIFQIFLLNKYNVILLQISTYLTHISALLFLIYLVFMFITWLRSTRNYMIVLYATAFSLISCSIIVSMIFLEYHFWHTLTPYRKPYPIYAYVTRQDATPLTESLDTAIDILSLAAFFSVWIATVILLGHYRNKFGKIKYFVLLSIPVLYYLFPFQSYFGNIFSSVMIKSPLAFGVAYVLTFSATKQIGALLFSIAFITASTLVSKNRVQKSLLISGIGIAILFGSLDLTTLQYRVYPPFGLVTEAFMPLGGYLTFLGIFTSAVNVSRDADLRKKFYKSAESQLSLLKTIGMTQMENELLKNYEPILARSNELEEVQYQPLEQNEVKEIIRDVLQELQSRQNRGAKSGSK